MRVVEHAVAPTRRTTNIGGYGSRLKAGTTSLRVLSLKLPGGPKTPEVLRRDGFQRIGGDTQSLQGQAGGLRRIRHDVVGAQQRDLIRGQFERPRRELQEQRLEFR